MRATAIQPVVATIPHMDVPFAMPPVMARVVKAMRVIVTLLHTDVHVMLDVMATQPAVVIIPAMANPAQLATPLNTELRQKLMVTRWGILELSLRQVHKLMDLK